MVAAPALTTFGAPKQIGAVLSQAQEWENLPIPSQPSLPVSPGSIWTGFSLDPRSAEALTAAPTASDRQLGLTRLTQARADGLFDDVEYSYWESVVLGGARLRDLAPMLRELDQVVAPEPVVLRERPDGLAVAIRVLSLTWVFVAVVTNVIWLASSAGYYWPFWPMFGVAIPVFILTLIRSGIRWGKGTAPAVEARARGSRAQRRRERRRAIRARDLR